MVSSQSWLMCKASYRVICIATCQNLLNHIYLQLSLVTWHLRSTHSIRMLDIAPTL